MSKITIKIISIVSFVIFCFSILWLLVNRGIINLTEKNTLYTDVIQFCDSQDVDTGKKISCAGFITSETTSNSWSSCFNILLYTGGEELQEIEICGRDFIIEWSNPYEDYDKYVPVDLEIQMSKNLFGNYKPDQITFNLMDDSDIFDILAVLPYEQDAESNIRNLVYIKEYQNIENVGYYLTRYRESLVDDILIITQARIKDLSVQDNEMILLVEVCMYGADLEIEIKSEGFSCVEGYTVVDEEYQEMSVLVNSGNFLYEFSEQEEIEAVFEFDPDSLNVDTYLESLVYEKESSVLLTTELVLISIIKR